MPDPVIRNRHADNVRYDLHVVAAVKAVVKSDPEQLLARMKDLFLFLRSLPGYRDAFKCSVATFDRVLRAARYSYKELYRMFRERDQEGRAGFAKVLLSIPLRCVVSADETLKDGRGLRRRRGR